MAVIAAGIKAFKKPPCWMINVFLLYRKSFLSAIFLRVNLYFPKLFFCCEVIGTFLFKTFKEHSQIALTDLLGKCFNKYLRNALWNVWISCKSGSLFFGSVVLRNESSVHFLDYLCYSWYNYWFQFVNIYALNRNSFCISFPKSIDK